MEAVLPFGLTRWKFDSEFRKQALKNLAHLNTLSAKLSFNTEGFAAPIEIAVCEDAGLRKGFKRYWAQQRKGLAWDYRFIKLSTIAEVDVSREARSWGVYRGDKFLRTEIVPESVLVDESSHVFEHRIRDLFLCMTIAAPGTVNLVQGLLYLDGIMHRPIRGSYSSFDCDVQYVRETIGWPTIKNLQFEKVWNWFHRIEGIEHGLGGGRIGRAIAAMSYLISYDPREESELEIVWALLGLEAIYCRASSGSMEQLLEKSQVLLGPINDHKVALREMYNLRSRLLHGDLDLPVRDSYWEGDPTTRAYHAKKSEAASMAKAMLVATLQTLVEHGMRDISFRYILNTSTGKNCLSAKEH